MAIIKLADASLPSLLHLQRCLCSKNRQVMMASSNSITMQQCLEMPLSICTPRYGSYPMHPLKDHAAEGQPLQCALRLLARTCVVRHALNFRHPMSHACCSLMILQINYPQLCELYCPNGSAIQSFRLLKSGLLSKPLHCVARTACLVCSFSWAEQSAVAQSPIMLPPSPRPDRSCC